MKITLNCEDSKQCLKTYFELIQFALPAQKKLSELEIKLLIIFLSLPEKFKYHRFSTIAKNKAMEIAKEENWILSRINVNNKIYSMIDKGVLRRDEDNVIYLNPALQKGVDKLLNRIENKEPMEVTFDIT